MATGIGLVAVAGAAAAIIAVGKSLADFGRAGLQLHYMGQELGVTAETLEKYRHAGVAAGMSSERAASGTETALRKMQDLGRRGSQSDAFQELVSKAGGTSGAELGDALL
jgi:hypothetical protein